ncbi:Carbohydrate-binding, CenC-like protein [Kalmanozyma brasiliensis GHG001]|uniref:Carbohydrate-binding, CenC-like protein n=1 Tax=Kalmanozyma brasiliensis (strain GHG001) TaxID=1365824 RepID=UPI0028682987|nr:Carbohydrate-binding, CenC-like protein [Kalmanozyma brasiliensis GHG001]KAF6767147.1 Carbohydrate-binding, CenC-like protein [Kalmanozyma brasiliensis GHG001]
MKLFFAALAAVLVVTAHGAAIPEEARTSDSPTIKEGPQVVDGVGTSSKYSDNIPTSDLEPGPLRFRKGPQVTDGTGASFQSGRLAVKLATEPKAKCIYDMNTFVESNLNWGTDGGLYAEMIRNRAFQSSSDSVFGVGANDSIGSGSLTGWQPIGSSKLELVAEKPLSAALPKSAKITCETKQGEMCGLKNLGFFGLPVEAGETYNASFYIRTDKPRKMRLEYGLFSTDLTQTWGKSDNIVEVGSDWTPVHQVLTPLKGASDINNVFAIQTNADGATFQINLVSLFPTTFEGTVVRKDVAEKMMKFKPKAIRWPGGNDLVGHSIASRFQWNNTLGPLMDRPGRLGNWQGWNTDGLGVVEMYRFIEKIGARLIVGLWAGVDANGNSVPLKDLEPYIQQQVDFVHFLLDREGKWAELRVQSGGSSSPYDVQAFLIGNEGQLKPAVDYQTRFDMLTSRLKKEFASCKGFDEIDLIASAPITVPTGYKYRVDLLNQPIYGTSADFVDKYHMYDSASRTNNTLFYSMEFAVINSGMEADDNIWFGPGRLHHSILQGSLAETIFILGMENNCDIVRGAAYAPELSNESDDRASESTPGMLEFDTTKVVGSTSWLMQSLVSANRISQSLPVVNSKELETAKVYVSAGVSEKGSIVLKLVNYSEKSAALAIDTGAATVKDPVCKEVAGNGPLDSNTLEKQPIKMQTCQAQTSGSSVSVELKKWSFTVLNIPAGRVA